MLASHGAKALKYFRACDTDGTGEIDLEEFKLAMFAADPDGGNSLGFSPNALLTPLDAFEVPPLLARSLAAVVVRLRRRLVSGE